MSAEPWSIAGLIRSNAARFPTGVALSGEGSPLTWAELDERASRVAQGLASAGIGRGSRVAFLDRNGPEFFEVLMGCGKVGAVMVPVNWRLAPPEMAQIIADSAASLLVVGPEFESNLDSFHRAASGLTHTVALGSEYPSWRDAHDGTDPGYEPRLEDVAIQLYTSGTTGLPKGAMLANANFDSMLGSVVGPWRLDSTSVSLVAMPLFHIGGSGWALAGMTVGARSVIVREVRPQALLETMQDEGVTNAFLVPAVLQMLCAVPGAREMDFSKLRAIKYGASPITDEALRRSISTFGCDFVQLYGLTETTGAITQLEADDHDPGGPRGHLMRSAGRAYPWIELQVVDPDSRRARPAGEIGELWVRGPQNMVGYWNKPEETARVIDSEGWFHTGDGGYIDDDGYVYLTDRIKDMIVSGGENVYPAEVENVLASAPEVGDVAVIGVPDPRWGETVKAVVVLADGYEPNEDTAGSVLEFTRNRLAHYKCPTSVDFVTELPRNPSGKVLKRELREPYWAGHERRVN